MRRSLLFLICALALRAQIVQDVRDAAAGGDFAAAERIIETQRQARGWTPELIEAHSWLARSALNARHWEKALQYAAETRTLCTEALKTHRLDREPHLPIALGAAIEVHAHALSNTGRRSEAIAFLHQERNTWGATSVRARIQKNINLLTLEGRPAPRLEGVPPETLRGHPTLLFFWAHWCGDCKAEGPILQELRAEFPKLRIVAPTRLYGYVAGGEEAPPATEAAYINDVKSRFYPWLSGVPVPVNAANFETYGSSTTPTLVLLDTKGIVRLYHPGGMTKAELGSALNAWAR